jgi:hypothetical protein
MLAVFGSPEKYQEWLLETLIDHVARAEAGEARKAAVLDLGGTVPEIYQMPELPEPGPPAEIAAAAVEPSIPLEEPPRPINHPHPPQ